MFTSVDAPSCVNNYAYFNKNWREWVTADVTGLWFDSRVSSCAFQWISLLNEPDQIRTSQQRSNSKMQILLSPHWHWDAASKCWQQFACAIATCWKCVLQVRKYEPASVPSLWYDPESSFHQGWNGLGSNWQKLVAFFFIQGQAHFEACNRRKTSMGSLIKCHS